MKKLKCAILGYGDRSGRYADYAVSNPEELEIVSVIDINQLKLNQAKEKFNLSNDALFDNLDSFLDKNIQCDFVINGTMDQLHYETTVKLLNKSYNILLEKPVTASADELLEINRLAKVNGCKVVVCHVLRYTPFYSGIKKIIDSGELGKIVNMQINEHVWYGHFVNSYVRGKWRSEKECGSGLLLAKCCHDTDLLCWLNNETEPEFVSSFGSKSFFKESNAPKDSTEFCYNCPHKNTCLFDAYKFHLEKDFIPFYTWADINKPLDEITKEEKEEFLKHHTYGKCAFKTDMDIVDRQCVSVNFKNGSIATLNVTGCATKAGRHTHIVCEYGEIEGYVGENKFIVRKYDFDKIWYNEQVFDLNKDVDLSKEDNAVAGHYGGDYFIMKDLIRFINGEKTSVATTTIKDSIYGHLICYSADKAMKSNSVINLDKEYGL